LLQACLSEDLVAAQAAFAQWAEKVPLFFVDAGSVKLLLLLYQRLCQWKVTYADMERLKGIARYYWVQHQCLMRELRELLQALNEAGVRTMLLKGAALNATVYADGTRLMSDLDIAVPRRQARQAMDIVAKLGWHPQFRDVDRLVDFTHGCHYRRGEGHLDLHWDFFHGKPLDDASQQLFWGAAATVRIGTSEVHLLSPTDQFLHTCEHGMRCNETAPFRWLADACLIYRQAGQFDWQRLANLAERFQLIQPIVQTLQFLDQHLQAEIPRAAFVELAARRSSFMSRAEFFVATRRMPGNHPFWRELPGNLFNYRRIRRGPSRLSLVDYLTRVNDFEPPFWPQARRLVGIEVAAFIQAVREKLHRFTLVASCRAGEIRINPYAEEAWDGFFAPEKTGHGILRWSGTNSSIRLPISSDRHRVVLRLAEIRPWYGDLESSLAVRVNRTLVAPQDIRFDNWEVSFELRPDMLINYGQQRLELRCPKWNSSGGDPRSLGVPVKEMLLQPMAA
jgi:hypothetical protein